MKIGVLPKSDNRNGWLETLPPQPAANRAVGTTSVDYAVVGGGFTGLAAARRLSEIDPQARIALIDAERIGNNAAGRCSGFAIDQAHNIRARNFAGSLDAERRQIALNRAGQDYLRDIVMRHEIDCDWREEGKIHGAATERGRALAKAYSGNLDLLGAAYRWIDAAGMKAITGTDFYLQGLHTPGTIQVQPAAMVTGMARSMPENVAVYEDSPVTGIAHGPPHRLELADGTISCPTLVLANNGFAPQFGYYRKSLIPVATWASLSRRLEPDEVETLGGTAAWGIIPADPFGSTVRRTADDRILVRNIYSYARRLNCEEEMRFRVLKAHQRSFTNRFAMLTGGRPGIYVGRCSRPVAQRRAGLRQTGRGSLRQLLSQRCRRGPRDHLRQAAGGNDSGTRIRTPVVHAGCRTARSAAARTLSRLGREEQLRLPPPQGRT